MKYPLLLIKIRVKFGSQILVAQTKEIEQLHTHTEYWSVQNWSFWIKGSVCHRLFYSCWQGQKLETTDP